METVGRLIAWLLVLGQLVWGVPVEAASSRAVAPGGEAPKAPRASAIPSKRAPNRRVPKVEPAPRMASFSTWPKDEDLFRARVFSEPLVPIGRTTPEENGALGRAIEAYQRRGGGEQTEDLTAFLEGRHLSPWRASLQLNLGVVYQALSIEQLLRTHPRERR